MNSSIANARTVAEFREAAPDRAGRSARVDDAAMVRAAAELTRDLTAPNPVIYWSDFLASAAVGYAALYFAATSATTAILLICGLVSILALYRAGSFIHELTHIKHSAVPGFRLAWNALIGIPMLIPSFVYEGIHNLHHARTRYGTADDPEYLPLALMKPWSVPLFVLIAFFGPVILLFRFAVLSPLSAVIPPLRTLVVQRYSGAVINPEFRRRAAEGEARRQWINLEIATSLWAITALALVATGIIPVKAFLVALGVAAGSVVLNQIRTLVAHLWENEGEVMSVTAQFLDSVNVPPPATLPALWAPVGLRYHAIHHLLPGLPYHALGEAHRRISAALGPQSTYNQASYRSLSGLVTRLIGSTFRRGA